MKTMKFFWAAALALPLLFTLICCDDVKEEDTLLSMTFANEDESKIFTINENLAFNVFFKNEEKAYTIGAGAFVYGIIDSEVPNQKWNENITQGIVRLGSMYSTEDHLNVILATIDVPVTMTYTKENGNITSVTIAFSGSGLGELAQGLMGGTWNRTK